MKSVLLIDGENFKKKIESVFIDNDLEKPFWHEYDFAGLLNKVLKGIEVDKMFFYFAKIKEHPETKAKSRELIQNQRLLKTHLENQGFDFILSGRVRGQRDGDNLVFREKGVDVRIAVDMINYACDDNKVKTIILGSSDSDLQPAVKEIRKREVECIYLGFETQPNKGLTYTTNRTILIRNSEVLEHNNPQTLFSAASSKRPKRKILRKGKVQK